MNPPPTLDSLIAKPSTAPPARRLPAWLVPAAILSAFAGLFLLLFGDRLVPAPRVAVASVLATVADGAPAVAAAGSGPAEGAVQFQASGWIEPAPLPIKATALLDGVIDKVHVHPGDAVTHGQPIASLIADDARLTHAAAQHQQRTLKAALTAQLAAVSAAERKLAGLLAEQTAAAARRDEAEDRNQRMANLPKGSAPEAEVVGARLGRDREIAHLEAAGAAVEEMRAEIERLKAEAEMKRGELDAAGVVLEQAALALRRTEIVAPSDGRILRLLAAPGQKKVFAGDDPDSATVAILYHPDQLQVRVDVPLADAAALQVGQPARIHCALLPDTTFQGTVTHITGEADVQRNTLQAKVSIANPADQLRPEMLCRVEFIQAATRGQAGGGATTALATWIPTAALSDGAVWVCDQESRRVTRRTVSTANETRDKHLRIAAGLQPGEWVVLNPRGLRDGQRVNPSLTEP